MYLTFWHLCHNPPDFVHQTCPQPVLPLSWLLGMLLKKETIWKNNNINVGLDSFVQGKKGEDECEGMYIRHF